MLVKIIVCLFAGLGAGFGTGFAGMSAAAVISPMLITFLGVPAYQAIGIALASDVLASAVSAYTYGKHKNLDIRNGIVMMAAVLIFTLIGSYISSLVPNHAMGNASVFLTMLLGIKFIVRPVIRPKMHRHQDHAAKADPVHTERHCGRFHLWIYRRRGGMMMLLLLTSVLGYELKTAVGTSVFIMTFTALTGPSPILPSAACRICSCLYSVSCLPSCLPESPPFSQTKQIPNF